MNYIIIFGKLSIHAINSGTTIQVGKGFDGYTCCHGYWTAFYVVNVSPAVLY